MINIIGDVFIIISLIFLIMGVIGMFRFKNFYSRILIASNIDTVGFILLMIGIMFKTGISWFLAKIILLIIIVLTINPVVTHSITRSAYRGGYRFEKENEDD